MVSALTRRVIKIFAPNLKPVTRNPAGGLWAKRSRSSGVFRAAKATGDAFKGIRREN